MDPKEGKGNLYLILVRFISMCVNIYVCILNTFFIVLLCSVGRKLPRNSRICDANSRSCSAASFGKWSLYANLHVP